MPGTAEVHCGVQFERGPRDPDEQRLLGAGRETKRDGGLGNNKSRVASETVHGGMSLEGVTRQPFLLTAPPQKNQFPIEFVTREMK